MPYSGGLRRSLVPYVGEQVWGTGINPVHELYGSPGLRVTPYPLREGESAPPSESIAQQMVNPEEWGYTHEDPPNTTVYYDDRPSWNEQPDQYRGNSDEHPPYNASQSVNENFRSKHEGAHRVDPEQKEADVLPSETVTEGWRNKPKGDPANAKPSDPSQYEIQTSMRQREQTRVNDQAVARSTDYPRASIASRIIGQRLKVYSGQLRHYDMFPRQQSPMIRPFSYRTAGTGRGGDMLPNEMFTIDPVLRTPPPDPYMGEREDAISEGFGYTPEDVGYY